MGCKARKKSPMTNVQRRKKIQWAWQCASWSCGMWEKVLISNESTFCLFENQANTYVRRFPGEVFTPEFLNLTVKHPLKVMVCGCGCISASGIGRLHIVNGMVNETKYIGILQKCIVPSAQQLFHEQFLFQDDNAQGHRTKLVTKWKSQKNSRTLGWPAQSPSIKPSEGVDFQS